MGVRGREGGGTSKCAQSSGVRLADEYCSSLVSKGAILMINGRKLWLTKKSGVQNAVVEQE